MFLQDSNERALWHAKCIWISTGRRPHAVYGDFPVLGICVRSALAQARKTNSGEAGRSNRSATNPPPLQPDVEAADTFAPAPENQ